MGDDNRAGTGNARSNGGDVVNGRNLDNDRLCIVGRFPLVKDQLS
jgi:hypothetical protein